MDTEVDLTTVDRDVLIAIIAELQAVIERLQRPRQLSGRIRILSRSVESDNRLEHDLRHHHFPILAAQAIPVIGVGTLAVPFHDCHHRCEGAAHTGRSLEAPRQLSHDRTALVQQLPTICPHTRLKRVAGRKRGDGGMHWMLRPR